MRLNSFNYLFNLLDSDNDAKIKVSDIELNHLANDFKDQINSMFNKLFIELFRCNREKEIIKDEFILLAEKFYEKLTITEKNAILRFYKNNKASCNTFLLKSETTKEDKDSLNPKLKLIVKFSRMKVKGKLGNISIFRKISFQEKTKIIYFQKVLMYLLTRN